MTLRSLREHFKLFSQTSIVPLKHSSIRSKQAKSSILQKLPIELIICIYHHLETPACKAEFAQTCRSFYSVSKQPCSKAGWIYTRVGPRFAIYYALLTCPDQCTSSFIKILLHFGAAVPYHLIQCVVHSYGKPKEQHYHQSRRRSSQSMDDYFQQQIQKMPFDGFVMLLYEGSRRYNGHIEMQQTPSSQSPSALASSTYQKGSSGVASEKELKRLVYERWFFPAPQPSHCSLRSLIKCREVFEAVFPLFEFDPNARAQLWETILSLFFDEAFKSDSSITTTDNASALSSNLSKHHQELFDWLGSRMNRRVMLSGLLTDEDIFCQVFSRFFAKYPVGYCHEKTMIRLLALLDRYVKTFFNLEMALENLADQQPSRPEIAQYLSHYLIERRNRTAL